jgi:hypothetical protein
MKVDCGRNLGLGQILGPKFCEVAPSAPYNQHITCHPTTILYQPIPNNHHLSTDPTQPSTNGVGQADTEYWFRIYLFRVVLEIPWAD